MRPAQRRQDGSRFAVALIELIISGIGISLQDALPALQMPERMFACPVAGELEDNGGRSGAREWAIIPDIGPESRGLRAATGKKRYRRVVSMKALGRENMCLDQRLQRFQQSGHRTDLVGQRREAQVQTFPGITLGLTVQGLMLAIFFEDDHRQEAGPGPSPRNGVERRRGLADLLTCATGELLTDGLDHLPLARNDLQGLGDVFAHLHDTIGATSQVQAVGASTTTRSRGRWSGKGFFTGLRRSKPAT